MSADLPKGPGTAQYTPITVHMPPSGIVVAESIHAAGFTMELRSDPYHKVLCVVRGRTVLETGRGRRIELRAGDFCPIPAGHEHRLDDRVAATVFLLCVDHRVMAEFEPRLGVWTSLVGDPIRSYSPSPGRLNEALHHLRELMRIQVFDSASIKLLAQTCRLDGLLLILADSVSDEVGSDSVSRVNQFVSELSATVHTDWRLDSAAKACGLSVRRFTGLLRDIRGTTFGELLAELRVQRCCGYLEDGLSIAAAAFASGFGDLSSCYRAFSKVLGMSPGAWRKTTGSSPKENP